MPRRSKFLPGLLATLAPTAALAHPGHHETHTSLENLSHLMTQPDHMLAATGLVVALVAGGGMVLARRRVRK